MSRFLPIVLVSALAAFALTPLARRIARRTGYVDRPSARKIHLAPIPLLGGLAIYSAILIGLTIANLARPEREAIAIGLAVTLVAAVGLWDDRFGMDPRIKLAGQMLAAAVLTVGGIHTRLFPWPALDVALTVFWVVGIGNAINLMDNMDGLAAGIAAVSAGAFLWLASLEGQYLVAGLAAAILGAAVGFLFWNFHPALTFMGDVGSLVLGVTLAALGMKLSFAAAPTSVTWTIPILVLGVPIFDTTLVVISRLRRRVPVYLGGSDHTSHRLVRLGLSHSRAVMTLYAAGALLGLTAVGVRSATPLVANLIFAAAVVAGLAAIVLLERVRLGVPMDEPGIVVIPGGGRARQAVMAARGLSRNVTAVVFPFADDGSRLPDSEVVACFAALADDPAAVSAVLDGWQMPEARPARGLESANAALRLQGRVTSAAADSADGAPQADGALLDLIRRAPMVLVGPGDLKQNALPTLRLPGMAEALRACKGARVLIGPGEPDLDEVTAGLFTHRLQVAADEPAHDLSRRLREIMALR